MRPENSVIELPHDLLVMCENFGASLAEHYASGGSPNSRAFSYRGMENNSLGLSASKIGECLFALHMEIDPKTAVKFDMRPDSGFDLLINRTRVDVKQTGMNGRYLIWPIRKNELFDNKQFDVMVLIKIETTIDERSRLIAARGVAAGWAGKKWFRSRRMIAPDGPAGDKLDSGTRYLPPDYLHRMGVFPGYSDDDREHYCHCGEWGSFGVGVALLKDQLGTWYCREHRPPPPPVTSPAPPPPSVMRESEPVPLTPTQGSLF